MRPDLLVWEAAFCPPQLLLCHDRRTAAPLASDQGESKEAGLKLEDEQGREMERSQTLRCPSVPHPPRRGPSCWLLCPRSKLPPKVGPRLSVHHSPE